MRPHKDGRQCDTRTAILNAAEQLLVESNISSLTVRAIAGRAGMTDMGVIHHFRSKDELIWSVIEHVGACLRVELSTLAVDWVRSGTGLDALVETLSDFYGRKGQLMIAVHQAGWRNNGPPVLEPVVEELHAARLRHTNAAVERDETRLAVSAMHQALALGPCFGFEFRRSAGFMDPDGGDAAQRRWWSATMAERLGIRR